MSAKHAKAVKPRRRATFTSVLGELLLTAGVIAGLFVAWQMWIGDILISQERYAAADSFAQQWAAAPAPLPEPSVLEPTEADAPAKPVYAPPALPHPGPGEVFATIQIPRFGADYRYPVAGSVVREITLDPIGVGVYDQATMPGQPGNFSVAGHRGGWGGAFYDIDKLRLGDAIVFETAEGWYTYRFRDLEYVTPNQVEVLEPVPHQPGVVPVDSILTITACAPIGSVEERIVAYGVFESFQPRAEGPPDSLEAV